MADNTPGQPRPAVMSQAPAAGDLPARVAHVVHALMEAWTQAGGCGPLTTAEVCIYDGEALDASRTRSALNRARIAGLAHGVAGLWFATDRAWEMRRALEDRYAREVD